MKPRKPRTPGPRRDSHSSSGPRDSNDRPRAAGDRPRPAGDRQRTPRYDRESLSRSRGLSIHTMDQSVIQSFEVTETLTGRRPKKNLNAPPNTNDFRADQRAEGRRMAYNDNDIDDNIGNRAPGDRGPSNNRRPPHDRGPSQARGPSQDRSSRPRGPGRDHSIKVWRPEGENPETPSSNENMAADARPDTRSDTRPDSRQGDDRRPPRDRHQSRGPNAGKPRAPGSGLHRSRRRFQRPEDEANAQAMETGETESGEKPNNAMRRDETRIHGVNACRSFFEKRKDDLIRVYLTQERSYEFNDVMKHCVENRLAYHIIPADELARASESEHHEGVCFLIRKRTTLQLDEWLMTLPKKGGVRVIALEQVGNSHNLGAIMRTAAHFGVDAVLFSANSPIHNGSAARTAEGGFESLTLVEYRDAITAVQALRDNGFDIIATSGEGENALYEQKLPKRGVIFFGEEKSGLAQPLLAAADMRLSIPGSGSVQSLNVSCATAVVLGEWNRTTKKKAAAVEVSEAVVVE